MEAKCKMLVVMGERLEDGKEQWNRRIYTSFGDEVLYLLLTQKRNPTCIQSELRPLDQQQTVRTCKVEQGA